MNGFCFEMANSDSDEDDINVGEVERVSNDYVSRVRRGVRAGARVRRYRFDKYQHDEDEIEVVGELVETATADGDYIRLSYGAKNVDVHAELYAFVAADIFLAKRTTLAARGLMKKAVNFCIEKKLASNVYDAYMMARPIIGAVMALTPAEREWMRFCGDSQTQIHLDRAEELSSGKVELTPSTMEKVLRMVTFVIAVLMAGGCFILWQVALSHLSMYHEGIYYGGVAIATAAFLYMLVEAYTRATAKFYRMIPEK